VERRPDSGTSQSRVHEHELQPMRPWEQQTADEDEEEQADERLLPMGRERCVRRGIGRPEAERGREEQEEYGDREEERGDEAANREEAPQQRLEEHLGLAGLLVR